MLDALRVLDAALPSFAHSTADLSLTTSSSSSVVVDSAVGVDFPAQTRQSTLQSSSSSSSGGDSRPSVGIAGVRAGVTDLARLMTIEGRECGEIREEEEGGPEEARTPTRSRGREGEGEGEGEATPTRLGGGVDERGTMVEDEGGSTER